MAELKHTLNDQSDKSGERAIVGAEGHEAERVRTRPLV